jgi:hypothetical protein
MSESATAVWRRARWSGWVAIVIGFVEAVLAALGHSGVLGLVAAIFVVMGAVLVAVGTVQSRGHP